MTNPEPFFPIIDSSQGGGARKAELVLHNARIFDSARIGPEPTLVSAVGDRIQWVGREEDLAAVKGPHTQVIDCEGRRVIPGLIDAHMHLFAYAANLGSIDCSPHAVGSVTDVIRVIRDAANQAAEGDWVRAWGYDEFHLAEGRAPTLEELDHAVPHNPVKITHRSGHASVLNTAGLRAIGIGNETPEPAGATLERDTSGELTGYLQEMEAELTTGAATGPDSLRTSGLLGQAFQRLLAWGVTSVQDATPRGALSQWDVLDQLRSEGELPLRITKMVAPEDIGELAGRNLRYGGGDTFLNVGPVKVMLNETGSPVIPGGADLLDQIWPAHAEGYQVAFHAVEEAGLAAAADAVEGLLRLTIDRSANVASFGLRIQDHRHRVEHCGICPPEIAKRLGAAGIVVVAQPGFIYEHGERYLHSVEANKQGWLHPLRTLARRGLRVALGSDAPVAPPDPIVAIAAAVTRKTMYGARVNVGEAVDVETAIRLHTESSAYAAGDEHLKGRIAPGQLADLVVIDPDPLSGELDAISEAKVLTTVVGGRIAYERS